MTFKKDNGYNGGKEKKPRYSLLNPYALDAVARVLTYGGDKYGDNNWHRCEDSKIYIDAMMRHINSHNAGEYIDPETGQPHMAHVCCSAMFVMGIWDINREMVKLELK